MYLTKIELDIRHRGIQRALGDCQQLHRLVMGLFGTDRKSAEVLYRLRLHRGGPAIYLYSQLPILPDRLVPGMAFGGERELSGWLAGMENGQIWRFDLLALPSKKTPREDGRNSQRRILRTKEERLRWLERKGAQSGFHLLSCLELDGSQRSGRHPDERGGRMYVDSSHYQGQLRIEDVQAFRAAVQKGIGPGKAYGLGMLLLNRCATALEN